MAKIKLFKASSFYTNYLNYFFQKNQPDVEKPYSDLLKDLFYDSFAWSDSIKSNLERNGQFEVEEVVINCDWIQRKWVKENGLSIKFTDEDWRLKVLKEQLCKFEPQVFFAHDYGFINPKFIHEIKKSCSSIKLVIGYDGIGLCNKDIFSECDIMLTCVDHIRDYYLSNGFLSEVFSYGFDANILNKLESSNDFYDVSFVGGLNLMKGGHHGRLKVLSSILSLNPKYFISSNQLNDHQLYKWPQRQRLYKGKLKEAWEIYKVGEQNSGIKYGLEMYQTLLNSKVSLNIHIDNAKDKAANIRLFEATGMGSCLLTDWKENIKDYFEPDKEIVTFKSADECIEKAKYLLDNEEVRKNIAKAGQEKTLNNYEMSERVKDIEKIIIQNI